MAKIRDVMTENVVSCSPDDTAIDAARRMAEADVGPIPVVDGDRLVGIVTDRDIVVRSVAEGRDPASTPLREIMSTDLVTVSPDDDLTSALRLMAQHQVRRLLVTEGDRLLGIVAQADVARAAAEAEVGEVVEEISK
jgi:CBS domain-containing protein